MHQGHNQQISFFVHGVQMSSFSRHFTQIIMAFAVLYMISGMSCSLVLAVPGIHINERNDGNYEKLFSILDDTNSIVITWTAPGDDGNSGRADYYIIKYLTVPINESNWGSASQALNPPAPLDAGMPQTYILGDLARGEHYYLAIKTYDDAGNCSMLSNVASRFAPGIMTPIPIGASIDTANNSAIVRARTVETAMPVYYEFALDTLRTFTHPTIAIDPLSDSIADATFDSLRRNVEYFWHCQAIASDHSDSSAWSATDSFTIVFTDNISPTVNVTSPNGRERWDAYSVHNINWTDNDNYGITAVELEYSTNGGSSWLLISDWTNGDSHSFIWSVPGTPSRNCRVKVSCRDASNNIGSDTSNRNFTIRDVSPPHVNLVFPNGGESLEIGADTLVSWQADDLVGVDSFMIDYSIDSGSSWNTITTWTAGNPGSYQWPIPPNALGQCLLRIFCMDSDGNAGCDSSNSIFYIIDITRPIVSITSPIVNDTLSGDSLIISWRAQDNGIIASTNIEYSTDVGATWNALWTGVGDTSGSYTWPHPEIGNLGIRVICTDQSQNAGGDSVFFLYTDIGETPNTIPREYSLSQSYPNPFNPSTTIEYGLPQAAHVILEIFDTIGRRVAIPINEYQDAGYHNVTWNADNLPSGAYFCRIKSGDFAQTKKMLLVK
jgi:hypothetical protein